MTSYGRREERSRICTPVRGSPQDFSRPLLRGSLNGGALSRLSFYYSCSRRHDRCRKCTKHSDEDSSRLADSKEDHKATKHADAQMQNRKEVGSRVAGGFYVSGGGMRRER